MAPRTIYVFGNGRLSFDDFLRLYVPPLEAALAHHDSAWVVCDFRGVDTLVMEYLKARTAAVTVFHVGDRPRYLPDRHGALAQRWVIRGGFADNSARNEAALAACTHYLAIDRFSLPTKPTSTAALIERCRAAGRIALVADVNRAVQLGYARALDRSRRVCHATAKAFARILIELFPPWFAFAPEQIRGPDLEPGAAPGRLGAHARSARAGRAGHDLGLAADVLRRAYRPRRPRGVGAHGHALHTRRRAARTGADRDRPGAARALSTEIANESVAGGAGPGRSRLPARPQSVSAAAAGRPQGSWRRSITRAFGSGAGAGGRGRRMNASPVTAIPSHSAPTPRVTLAGSTRPVTIAARPTAPRTPNAIARAGVTTRARA